MLSAVVIKKWLFWVNSVCIFLATLIGILAIWDFIGDDIAWRVVFSLVFIVVGGLTFGFNHKLFNK